MPRVRFTDANNQTHTGSGICFAFCGRYDAVNYAKPLRKFVLDLVALGNRYSRDVMRPYLEWLATESSWSKYVDRLETDLSAVSIKVDVPGHCVISTASAFRFAFQAPEPFHQYFKICKDAGGDPSIALLVFYSLFTATGNHGVNNGNNGSISLQRANPSIRNSSGNLGLGDNEFMNLHQISPGSVYSFIRKDFELLRDDRRQEGLYKDTGRYDQSILSSFTSRTGNIHFGTWLRSRFKTLLTSPDLVAFQGSSGMGSDSSNPTQVSGLYLMETVGWVLRLTQEFKTYGRFLGLKA